MAAWDVWKQPTTWLQYILGKKGGAVMITGTFTVKSRHLVEAHNIQSVSKNKITVRVQASVNQLFLLGK